MHREKKIYRYILLNEFKKKKIQTLSMFESFLKNLETIIIENNK